MSISWENDFFGFCITFIVVLILTRTVVFAQQTPNSLPDAPVPPNMCVDVRAFGAKADGRTDDTAAIQAAIDAAAEHGGTVYLPAGEYLIAGNLQMRESVALMGANTGPMSIGQRKVTILLATAGRDNEDAPPFVHMTHATAVRNVTVFYPEQKCDNIAPYPWTFQMEGFDITLEDVTLINSYNGIRTGPGYNVRHRIRSVVGTVLRRGIYVDACTDIGRVENVQFHCHWWSDPAFEGNWEPVFEYMWKHLEAFVFARTDWEYITNNFVFPARIGWRFIKSEHGMANGHLTACGADATQTAVQIDEVQPMGLLITGGQFVSFLGDAPVQVRVAPEFEGNVRFVNCAFWGPASHNAVIEGDGFVSFSDCYFSNWNEEKPEAPLVLARSGRLQVQNSTFATTQPSIKLEAGVRHAIIRGNNGAHGVTILNNARNTIISENEDYRTFWTDEVRGYYRLDIGAPGTAHYLSDWHGIEVAAEWPDSGKKRWSKARSSLKLPILANTTYTISLDVYVPERAMAPENGLYVGDKRVIALTQPGVQMLTGTLPPQTGDVAELCVDVKKWVPAEHGDSSDQRTLGICARTIILKAENADSSRVFLVSENAWQEEAEILPEN